MASIALLCLIYPGARALTAQLLGIGTPPPAAAEVTADDAVIVASRRSSAHRADNPLALDARAAAGVILPTMPDESELVAYVGGEEQFVLGLDNTVSADFRDVSPASVAPADNGGARFDGGARSGDRSRMVAGAGSASAGFGSAADGRAAEPQATAAANDIASGDERAATLGRRAVADLASTVTAESRIEAGSSHSGDGSTNGEKAASAAGSAASPAIGTTTTLADSVPVDIAPAVMVLAEIAGGEPESGSSGAGAQSVSAEVAADVPGVLAEVPEPVKLLIFGLGLASVAYRIRSRA